MARNTHISHDQLVADIKAGTIDTVLQTVPYVALTPEALAESRSAWDAR